MNSLVENENWYFDVKIYTSSDGARPRTLKDFLLKCLRLASLKFHIVTTKWPKYCVVALFFYRDKMSRTLRGRPIFGAELL